MPRLAALAPRTTPDGIIPHRGPEASFHHSTPDGIIPQARSTGCAVRAGECWLKWQADPAHPLYGQRGKFTAEFREKHANAHKRGRNPDGTPRNLSVPTHVPWTGGIM